MYYCTYLYALRQSNQLNEHREDITSTTLLFPKYTIMFPTGQFPLDATSRHQMVSYDLEINAISAMSIYIQDISN